MSKGMYMMVRLWYNEGTQSNGMAELLHEMERLGEKMYEDHKYDDIIQLPHPTSAKHPRMSLYDRAAQFSPFAALTGHEQAIEETARLTHEKMELDEDEKERLNEKLQLLLENRNKDISVTITYFAPDERKEGGAYVSYTGSVKKIDRYKQVLIMKDNTEIPMEQIKEIESELFHE